MSRYETTRRTLLTKTPSICASSHWATRLMSFFSHLPKKKSNDKQRRNKARAPMCACVVEVLLSKRKRVKG